MQITEWFNGQNENQQDPRSQNRMNTCSDIIYKVSYWKTFKKQVLTLEYHDLAMNIPKIGHLTMVSY